MIQVAADLDPDTINVILSVVDEAMYQNKIFKSVDVSNGVKRRGYHSTPVRCFGTHELMQPEIYDAAMVLGRVHGYEAAPLDTPDQGTHVFFPRGSKPQDIHEHVVRRAVQLMPVEVWLALGGGTVPFDVRSLEVDLSDYAGR